MKTRFMLALMAIIISLPAIGQAEEVSWAEKISLKGDLRLREELIDKDGAKDERWRARVRARLAAKAKVNDTVTAKIRLASGGDDPVSSNETLDSGFSTKDIRLDRAYVIWAPETLGGLELWGGKMANPFIAVSDLIWDGDLNPEGAAIKHKIGEDELALLLNAGIFQVEERSSSSETFLYAGQAAVELEPSDGTTILAGAGIFQYDNMKGMPTLYDPLDGFGNDVTEVTDPTAAPGEEAEVIETLYANDFSEVEVFAQVGLDLGVPVKVFGNYVVNSDADKNDTGYLAGVKVGKAKEPGSVEFGYDFRNLEANAVVGAFSDSDSGGGGTNVEGHRIKGKYQISKNWQAAVTVFLNEVGDTGVDYTRAQFDLVAKF